jgi:hypothetical protein
VACKPEWCEPVWCKPEQNWFTPECVEKLKSAEDNLRAAGISFEEFHKGWRAQDACIVALLLGGCLDKKMVPSRRGLIKKPCIKGWREKASSDPCEILSWQNQFQQNWSLPTGIENGVWVIDVDGEQGREDFARLVAMYGPLPPTIRVISGRPDGGSHFWFKANTDGEDLLNKVGVFGCKIDIRGWGGHIVSPASLHISGKRYQWAEGCAPDEMELASLPKAWFDALPKRVERDHKPSSPRSGSRRSPQRAQVMNEEGSAIIGDGPGRGGFHGPIYKLAIRFIRDAGIDADAQTLVAILKAKVLNAPVSPDRDPATIERYSSDAYLLEQIENARAWVAREKGI